MRAVQQGETDQRSCPSGSGISQCSNARAHTRTLGSREEAFLIRG